VLELDLAVTKDNVLVVSHSPYLTQPASDDPRMAAALKNERQCDGPALPPGTLIHSLTLAQLKQYDCGAHALSAFPHQQAVPHTTIPTFDEVLDLAPKAKYDTMMGITDGDKSFAHIAKVSGADILSPDLSLVTPEEVKTAHELHLQVAPYTANTVEQWQKLADAHVDAIITDDPAGLLAWLRTQNPPLHP
jgi:glycerophosphoryl diester phosphodiesterase